MAIAARNQDELAAAIDRLGPRAHSYLCDVRDHDQIVDLGGAVEGELGPIEVSIHVAGIIHVGPAADVSLAHFDDAIATMLKGPIELAWAVLPGMRRRRRGPRPGRSPRHDAGRRPCRHAVTGRSARPTLYARAAQRQ